MVFIRPWPLVRPWPLSEEYVGGGRLTRVAMSVNDIYCPKKVRLEDTTIFHIHSLKLT